MFNIYTPEGRSFSGSLEKLRRVERAAEAGALKPVVDDEENRFAEQERSSTYTVSRKAAEQYRSLLHSEKQREPVYHAYQIMTSTVQLLYSSWPLSRAREQFRRYPYQLFPVVNDRRELTGALSRQQLYEFILDAGENFGMNARSIGGVFIKPDSRTYSADPVTDVRRITTLLVEKNLDALPIIEESGRIVGIVSRSDILQCTVSDPPLSLWC